jgi:hypothetical protein
VGQKSAPYFAGFYKRLEEVRHCQGLGAALQASTATVDPIPEREISYRKKASFLSTVKQFIKAGGQFGFVFVEVAQQIGEPWSVTLSHEALELIGDPETNLLVMGPHPAEDRIVFHWFEMCDAVQAESYDFDGSAVSNFLLPLYFTGTRDVDEVGARNDFLGRSYGSQTLKSFGINPGGYIGFFDPQLGEHDTYSIRGDMIALKRLEVKRQVKQARRAFRYKNFAARMQLQRAATNGEGERAGNGSTRKSSAEFAVFMTAAKGKPFVMASTREQFAFIAETKHSVREW